jgi:hypothetical protein
MALQTYCQLRAGRLTKQRENGTKEIGTKENLNNEFLGVQGDL